MPPKNHKSVYICNMREDFVHFIWQQKLWNFTGALCQSGQSIQVFDNGVLNHDAGPDFAQARLAIDNQSWAGNVEMHLKASDWKLHKHSEDLRYYNVILHVVWHDDGYRIMRPDGTEVPTLEIGPLVPPDIQENYKNLYQQLDSIPCAKLGPAQYEISMSSALHRALADRMITKAARFEVMAAEYKNDWQEVFYKAIAKYMGMKVNAEAMEELAKRVPNDLLAKNKQSIFALEALLFGQAGFLNGHEIDDYHGKLKKEYAYIKAKHGLESMESINWKFSRMRPPNFPTVRIAQLANLIFYQLHMFSKIVNEKNVMAIKLMFETEASEYWQSHFRFGVESKKRTKKLGESTINSLIINVIAPILFAYGNHRSDEVMKNQAFDLLELIEAEDNKYTRNYTAVGFPNRNAYESQALLGLRELYCEPRMCTKCAIGIKLLMAKT
jgi:hypothetical protein